MTPIHLNGFGWLGSLLALHLDADGVPFTWSDPDARHAAWRASNGVIYPDNDPAAQRDAKVWARWYADGLLPDGLIAPALFAYSQKATPHGGKYAPIRLWGDVRSSPPGLAYIVNVADVVRAVRDRFADRRVADAPDGSLRVESHGFGRRLGGLRWGWTALARVSLPDPARRALDEVGGLQLYGRVNRFEIAHATSVPGRPGVFKIGTSSIKSPGSDPVRAAEHFARRSGQIATLFPGVRVLDANAPVEGWRPEARSGDTLASTRVGDTIVLPSASHSGVRRAPTILASALAAIRDAS